MRMSRALKGGLFKALLLFSLFVGFLMLGVLLVDVFRDGLPYLVDFQLASVHARRGALFASRAREDLRHVEKHRRRYTRLGRGPRGELQRGAGADYRRSWIARAWKRGLKPLYELVTRRTPGDRGGEERRSENGPWPRWTPPLGAGVRECRRGRPSGAS